MKTFVRCPCLMPNLKEPDDLGAKQPSVAHAVTEFCKKNIKDQFLLGTSDTSGIG